MNSYDVINSLYLFYDKCLRSGFVKIQEYNVAGMTLILSPGLGGSQKDGIRHMDTIIMNPKRVCWITNKRSNKNLRILNEIRNKYLDRFYVSAIPYRNGTKYKFVAYSINGKPIKKWKIGLFSINLG